MNIKIVVLWANIPCNLVLYVGTSILPRCSVEDEGSIMCSLLPP